jgi:hypothetical protein
MKNHTDIDFVRQSLLNHIYQQIIPLRFTADPGWAIAMKNR